MSRLLIRNIGLPLSRDLEKPILDADTGLPWMGESPLSSSRRTSAPKSQR